MEASKEEPVAKRQRMETQDAEQIIQELRRVNQNLQAQLSAKDAQLAIKDKRIKELEQINLKSFLLMDGEIKNIHEPKFFTTITELPDECLLKIFSYLSNFDVLRNVAAVSQKFHELSQDRHLIRKIKVDSESWLGFLESLKVEYCKEFLEVVKRSLNLRFLMFDFSRWYMEDVRSTGRWIGRSGELFLKTLPSMNHQFLEELQLRKPCAFGNESVGLFETTILKYVEKCPNLKVIKFEWLQDVDIEDAPQSLFFACLSGITSHISSFKHKNLQEFHLMGFVIDLDKPSFKNLLETIAENLPNLQGLYLTAELSDDVVGPWDEYAEICQKFASEKNIKLEIRGLPKLCDFDYGVKSMCCGHLKVHSSRALEIFRPK